jgi:hypothetical protein
MAEMRVHEEVDSRPPILEVLPPALSQDAAPEHCVCRRRARTLSRAEKAAHERVHDDWRIMRIAWCEAKGYEFIELVQAERARPLRLVADV